MKLFQFKVIFLLLVGLMVSISDNVASAQSAKYIVSTDGGSDGMTWCKYF